MQYSRLFWPLLSLVLVAGLGFVLGQGLVSPEENYQVIVKSYKIPKEKIGRAKGSLKRLFGPISERASVQSMGAGTLVVRMPKSFEGGVDSAIADFIQSKTQAARQVSLDYWTLYVSKEDRGLGEEPADELSDVLDSISKVEGFKSVKVLEHLSSKTAAGSKFEAKGMISKMFGRVYFVDDRLVSQSNFETDYGKVQSDFDMTPGEFIVIGQNTVRSKSLQTHFRKKIQKNTESHSDKIYYVVRATMRK